MSEDIRIKAKESGVRPIKMNKTDLIHSIQRSEDNIECYATDRVHHCGELDRLWRTDCVDPNLRRRKEMAKIFEQRKDYLIGLWAQADIDLDLNSSLETQ